MKPHSYAKPAHHYARRGGLLSGLVHGVVAVIRLILPVLILLVISFWADLSGDKPVTWLDATFEWVPQSQVPSAWLTVGHLIYPLSFFVLNLINRRYGVGYASASVIISWIILLGFAFWFAATLGLTMTEVTGLSIRTMTAFVAAAFSAQIVAIMAYEVTRGFPWWRAPFYGSLAATFTFCLIFFPGAMWAQTPSWSTYMIVYALILMAGSFLALFPYYALKTMLRPMRGLGYALD